MKRLGNASFCSSGKPSFMVKVFIRNEEKRGEMNTVSCGDRLCPSAQRPVGGTLSEASSGPMSSWAAETTVAEGPHSRGTLGSRPLKLMGPRMFSSGSESVVWPGLAHGTGLEREDQLSPGAGQPPTRRRSADGASRVWKEIAASTCAPGAGAAALASATNGRGSSALGKVTCPSFCMPGSLTNARFRGGSRKIR